jgi:ribosomal protein L40E
MTSPASIFCKRCGAKNPRDSQACDQCGAPLHAGAAPHPAAPPAGMIFCMRCGAKNPRDSQYCDQCSAPLRAGPGVSLPPPGAAGGARGVSAPVRPGGPSAAPPAASQAPPRPAVPLSESVPVAKPAGPAPPPYVAPPSAAPPYVAPTPPAPPAAINVAPAAPAPTKGRVKGARAPGAAKRKGPPFILIGGAVVVLALIVFLVSFGGVLFAGLSGNDLQTSIATAVSQQATAQSEQGAQIRLALTQLANSGGSQSAQATAVAQATAQDVVAQATATAVIAQVATYVAEKHAADTGKGPAGQSQVVVPVVFPPAPARLFLTPPPLPAAQTFTGAPGASPDTPAVVSVPVTITNTLPKDDTPQYYQIDLSKTAGGSLVVSLVGARGAQYGQYVYLLDAAGRTRLGQEHANPGAPAALTYSAKPAVYQVSVAGYGDPKNPYTLRIEFHPNGANNSPDRAAKLGLVGSAQAFLSSPDDAQWYAVDMSAYPQGGQFVAGLTVPAAAKGRYRVSIIDTGGVNAVDSASVSAGQNDQVSAESNAAKNYFVRVDSSDGFSWTDPYVLGVYFLPHSANGTPDHALDITAPTLAKVRIAAPSDVVYLRFKITQASAATVKVQTPPDGSRVWVGFTDANDETKYMWDYIDPGQQGKVEATLQNPGTYLLKVAGDNGHSVARGAITLDLSVTPQK